MARFGLLTELMNMADQTESNELIDRTVSRIGWADVVKHPAVVTALITTILGSLGVAFVTNSVNQSIAQRDLQVKIVETLVEYTKVPDFTEASSIAKLDALIRLLADNRDTFELDLKGFQSVIRSLQEDALIAKDQIIRDAELQNQRLQEKMEELSQDPAEKKVLEDQIAENKTRIDTALAERNRLTNALELSRGDLESALAKIAELESELESKHPYLGGRWIQGDGTRYSIHQYGVDGKELAIIHTSTNEVFSGVFETRNRFSYTNPNKTNRPLRSGTASDSGDRIVLSDRGLVWTREVPPID